MLTWLSKFIKKILNQASIFAMVLLELNNRKNT